MKSKIEIDGTVHDLASMRQDEQDNLILDLALLRGMTRQQIAQLIGVKTRSVNLALGRALKAQNDLDGLMTDQEAAILRIKRMLSSLYEQESTSSNVDSITRLERLLAKLGGYSSSAREQMITTIYRNPDEFETEADRARKDATAARTISGGGVALYLEALDTLPGGGE